MVLPQEAAVASSEEVMAGQVPREEVSVKALKSFALRPLALMQLCQAQTPAAQPV